MLGLLALLLEFLQRLVEAAERSDLSDAAEVRAQPRSEQWEQGFGGTVCAGVVIDDKLVVGRVVGGGFGVFVFVGWAVGLFGSVVFLFVFLFWGTTTTHKEFARVRNNAADVAMQTMFAQQIDCKLIARLGEAPLGVQRDDIGKNTVPLAPVHHFQKAACERAVSDHAVLSACVMRVETVVLAVERVVEQAPAHAGACEVGRHERGETDVVVGELVRDGAGKLQLVGFEREDAGFLGRLWGVFGVDDLADQGGVVFGPPVCRGGGYLAGLLRGSGEDIGRRV